MGLNGEYASINGGHGAHERSTNYLHSITILNTIRASAGAAAAPSCRIYRLIARVQRGEEGVICVLRFVIEGTLLKAAPFSAMARYRLLSAAMDR